MNAENNTHKSIGLIGSPNCGKTTLFNRLTGAQQTTGNWPGVTVEQKKGQFQIESNQFEIIDLPGVYSLESSSHAGLDEKIARDFLQSNQVDLLVNVVDATSLERQLYLTAQLLHMGLPIVVILNRMDMLDKRNIKIDVEKLAEELQCPVIPISAYLNQGISELKQQIPQLIGQESQLHFDLPEVLHDSVHAIHDLAPYESNSCWRSLQTLVKPEMVDGQLKDEAKIQKEKLEAHYQEDLALVVADLYFQFAHNASHACLTLTDKFTKTTTDKIDNWVLSPVWGIPIFLAVMYLLFAFSIALGNLFIDFFDLGAQALFVDAPTVFLESINAPAWLIALLANGLGGGLQVVATFIPIIGALFLLLSLLEETGYMQRAAFIMDRGMRRLGLSGQAFIPLVVGFGCNVPSVLATRTLPDERDRIMTILMAPFMSCSARLTVYVLFATAFFVDYAALMVFSLYLIGILSAVVTALMLKKTLLPGEAPPLLMELPTYHKPAAVNVLLNTKNKLKGFVVDAGKIIVIVVLILNFFNSMGTDGSFGNDNQPNSVLSTTAKAVTPIFTPLGLEEENWPATVGLITGLLAKEVVVGALDALYTQQSPAEEGEFSLGEALLEAGATIPENASNLFSMILDPVGLESISDSQNQEAAIESLEIDATTIEKMSSYFSDEVSAYAYLLLVLLYFPCVATLGAMKQELGTRWMLYSGAWSLLLGYSVAVAFYQTMTFSQHPFSSSLWLIAIGIVFSLLYIYLKQLGKKRTHDTPANKGIH